MQHITLNLDAEIPVATPAWVDLDQRFRDLEPTDPDNQPALINMVRELVESLTAPAHRHVLQLVGDTTTQVHLFADFHSDEYGGTSTDHLALSVMLGCAPLILDDGIRDIRDLPLPADTTELGVLTVLAALVDYANTLIRRAVEAFTGLTPSTSPRARYASSAASSAAP